MSKPLVIYHAGCWDGFCAAWIAKRTLGDADFVPANYGDIPPDVAGRCVYILDFSFKRPVMIELSQKAQRLVVLDHHKTAEMELFGLSAGSNEGLIRFDMDKSGGRLAQEYFEGRNAARNWLVDYTEDRDLWLWKLKDSREINAALRSYPLDFALWDALRERQPIELAMEGSAILRFSNQLVDAALRFATVIKMDGHKVKALNTTCMISEIGEKLCEDTVYPFSATYFIRGDGKKVWSLRSRGEFDVSVIAKAHGGGGHKNAAGYTEDPVSKWKE